MKELNDIKKAKEKLIRVAKKKGLYENFGQEEVRELQDKYGYTDAIREFDNWCMNIDNSYIYNNNFSYQDVLRATGKLSKNVVENTTSKGGLLMF